MIFCIALGQDWDASVEGQATRILRGALQRNWILLWKRWALITWIEFDTCLSLWPCVLSKCWRTRQPSALVLLFLVGSLSRFCDCVRRYCFIFTLPTHVVCALALARRNRRRRQQKRQQHSSSSNNNIRRGNVQWGFSGRGTGFRSRDWFSSLKTSNVKTCVHAPTRYWKVQNGNEVALEDSVAISNHGW